MMKMVILGKELGEENCGSQLLKGQFNGLQKEEEHVSVTLILGLICEKQGEQVVRLMKLNIKWRQRQLGEIEHRKQPLIETKD